MTLIRKRWLASAAVAVLASATLAGCGSSGTSGSGGSSSSSGGSSADLAKAQQEVTSLEAVTTKYPVPTAKVSGVSSFKGRKVYYIPLAQAIPGFVDTAKSMKQALGTAGLSQQVCDGQGQPSAIASCVQQAVAANAAGIVLDAIPYGMAQNALDAAKAKGIPIIIADQYAPTTSTTNTDQVTYVPGATDQPSAIAWWIINASKGKAKAIIAEEIDSPSSKQYVTNSLSIYKQYCPGCDIEVKDITATTDALLASDTSSNILRDPGVEYYYTEFEDSLQDTVQGIQQSGHATSVALSVAGGSVNGLGLLKNGTVKAVVAVDEAYAGYALTDEILRMMTKSAPVAEPYPVRLFTADNIGSISVTTAAESSGLWFGDASFETSYSALWGVG
ncbi:sugar ABC transporter substrate-binding protein [Actinospica sp. MGRD01-02]|uniref:Sugar ABC transporter substrate-binding protein n=1 Tax=Actinospica acidithermotolerans TaxID=2828514 RepID=A0A941IJJ9_9ACTN|nr:substrate-binding domain-containing protein [Actinospica acidithermotolerans]MBR7830850.1 sugar ABC transporter substrate-binding protein [Actinospica acidithermotolerans]